MTRLRPTQLPIFPLPNTVLLPGEELELLVFDPRHLKLLARARSLGGMVGIVRMKPGWEGHYRDPPLYGFGGLAEIRRVWEIGPGEFSLHLLGRGRFSIRDLVQKQPFIEGDVRYPRSQAARAIPWPEIDRLLDEVVGALEGQIHLDRRRLVKRRPGPRLDRLASALPLNVDQRQLILESESLEARAEAILGALRASLFDIGVLRAMMSHKDMILSNN